MIPGSATPLLLAQSGDDGYKIDRSLRFNSADSAYLNRTPSSAGNRKTFTFSAWAKLSELGTEFYTIFQAGSDDFRISSNIIGFNNSGTGVTASTAVLRDPSAWYHIVLVVDTTLSNNRTKIYLNNELVAQGNTYNLNEDTPYNNASAHYIGKNPDASGREFDGYLADVHFIDGQALAPTDFGEFDDNNVWQPKKYIFTTNSNNGTTWSSTTNGNFWTAVSRGADKAFNGSINGTDYAQATTGNTATVSGLGITGITSIRVNIAKNSSSDNWGTFALDSTDLTSWLQSNYASVGNSGTWIDVTSQFTSTTLGSISVTTNSSSVDVRLAGVEINGYILLDGSDDNSFHLDFSDNSSNAALGTDSSENSNDWTVNNIAASGVTYTTNVSAAVNGTVPAPGNPYWIDIVPSNANFNYSSNTTNMNNVFDGSTSTFVYWVGDQYSIGNVLSATFDLRNFTTVTSLRIYHSDINYTPYSAELLDSDKNVISGTTTSLDSYTAAWASIPVSGTPRYLRISCTSGASRRLRLYAIEVNGSILTNELASNIDSLVDSPTNGTQTDTGVGGEVVGNYCTLNPLAISPNVTPTLSNGNLEIERTATSAQWTSCGSTFAVNSGKYYWELSLPTINGSIARWGVADADDYEFNRNTLSTGLPWLGSGTGTSWSMDVGGNTYHNGSTVSSSYTSTVTTSDVIGVALDCDANTLTFYKNGTSLGVAHSNVTASRFVPAVGLHGGTHNKIVMNFGQRPFAYTAPSGFKALCTTNLPTPTIADGSTAFDVALYTGNGSGQTISGLNFSPDLVWLKIRSGSYYHNLLDTIRGGNARLSTNRSDAENTGSAGGAIPLISSFNADGFTLPNGNINVNQNNSPYVAWNWDAGTSTVSNTDGNITSSVRANPSAGFSIVTWTGTANATVGHGLNAAPQLVITKSRSNGVAWRIWSAEFSNLTADYLGFSTASPVTFSGTYWGSMTSTTIGLGAGTYDNNIGDMIAYCFTPVEGYLAMGSYTGNGSNDGTFVFTGMRIKWLMIKEISTGSTAIDPGHWMIVDTERDTYNIVNRRLHAELTNSEYTNVTPLDILSNGFKYRQYTALGNKSGVNYMYLAFAEHPFKTARAR